MIFFFFFSGRSETVLEDIKKQRWESQTAAYQYQNQSKSVNLLDFACSNEIAVVKIDSQVHFKSSIFQVSPLSLLPALCHSVFL